MKFAYSLLTALALAAANAYTPPADLEDGVYLVDTSSPGDSAKTRRNLEERLVRIGDIIQADPAAGTSENNVKRDVFTNHERGHSCHDANTMMLTDYSNAMASFKAQCEQKKVPARKKNGLICSGKQGILYAKAGSSIVYHCNVGCSKQNCGGGHIQPFEEWADKTCGRLKGGFFYSDWDFTMGRDEWGSSFCNQVI
ncbi:hypothetical protein PFICI_11269 [Pestalotiopsis fici W106-1]|uniref:Uncharacterized protein n=1 Tax=Pestalotiopsis fici (strain W106-1 / CGMCC3.15140) TaxID=1229662 RepID=W3WU68_PESFW|nr:uncharacterized protein PFICI_11269 [Pestalotiopsis fici W106-1]ETS77395.1 hypothetical protein PFICI_11269 [Pestalotiopsis fici W106-1]